MDFETYRAKLTDYRTAFLLLRFVPGMGENLTADQTKKTKKVLWESIENLINGEPCTKVLKSIHVPLPVDQLSTLKNINIAADQEALAQQVEKLKDEIMVMGRFFSWVPHLKDKKNILEMTDFIRNPRGKIVYPFDYWHDCVDVYARKYLLGSRERTNGEILKEKKYFKSGHRDDERAKLDLVSNMLSEIEQLMESVLQNKFPPRTMKGTKQPTMIN